MYGKPYPEERVVEKEVEKGYVFRRIDARAKVFIEYGPAEKGWAPVNVPGYLRVIWGVRAIQR